MTISNEEKIKQYDRVFYLLNREFHLNHLKSLTQNIEDLLDTRDSPRYCPNCDEEL